MTHIHSVDKSQMLRDLTCDQGYLTSVFRAETTGLITRAELELLITTPTEDDVAKMLESLKASGIGGSLGPRLLSQFAEKRLGLGNSDPVANVEAAATPFWDRIRDPQLPVPAVTPGKSPWLTQERKPHVESQPPADLTSSKLTSFLPVDDLSKDATKTWSVGAGKTPVDLTEIDPFHERARNVQASAQDWASWQALADAIALSPVPDAEWKRARELFEDDARLAQLLGTSDTSIQRYASKKRKTPDDISERLHALMMIASDLSGTFNTLGVRRWFTRTRVQLEGHSPADMLGEEWSLDSPGYQRVRALADRELGFQAS